MSNSLKPSHCFVYWRNLIVDLHSLRSWDRGFLWFRSQGSDSEVPQVMIILGRVSVGESHRRGGIRDT